MFLDVRRVADERAEGLFSSLSASRKLMRVPVAADGGAAGGDRELFNLCTRRSGAGRMRLAIAFSMALIHFTRD